MSYHRQTDADAALLRGEHVHKRDGDQEACQGGDPQCTLWGVQLTEAMEAWSDN